LPCFFTDGKRLVGSDVFGDDRGLAKHDALPPDVHEDVGGSEVDSDVDDEVLLSDNQGPSCVRDTPGES